MDLNEFYTSVSRCTTLENVELTSIKNEFKNHNENRKYKPKTYFDKTGEKLETD